VKFSGEKEKITVKMRGFLVIAAVVLLIDVIEIRNSVDFCGEFRAILE
jgi:hypothetical protein